MLIWENSYEYLNIEAKILKDYLKNINNFVFANIIKNKKFIILKKLKKRKAIVNI